LDETSIPWFRLLYIYSAGLREPLVELIATEERILSYIDMPIQHASDPVLKRMRRPERRDRLYARIEGLRSDIPDLTLRTTVMVGSPGETADEFRSLLDFMEDVEFDRLGAFAFSPQKNTRAADMQDLFVPEDVAASRLEEVIEVQRAISADLMGREIGRTCEAIIERPEDGRIVGRTRAQADDVDGITYLGPASDMLPAGTLVEVEITGAGDFDLEGKILREVRSVAAADGLTEPGHVGRALPVAMIGLDGGWGR
ncbi:MAG: hypothetical protein V3S56_04195, partial [Gemmatimonadota bacterium]